MFGRYRTVAAGSTPQRSGDVAATKPQFLVRLRADRRAVPGHLPDGSVLSLIGGVNGSSPHPSVACYGGTCRLAATLWDHRAWPADVLIALYRERRESTSSIRNSSGSTWPSWWWSRWWPGWPLPYPGCKLVAVQLVHRVRQIWGNLRQVAVSPRKL